MLTKLGFTSLALISTIAASADLHRWVDADGRIHYSDLSPSGQVTEQKTLPGSFAPRTSNAPTPTAKPLADRELEFRKRRIGAEEARLKEESDRSAVQQQEKNCELATNNLKNLQSGRRIARYDTEGERAFFDDDEKAQRVAETQKSVDEWCNPKGAENRRGAGK